MSSSTSSLRQLSASLRQLDLAQQDGALRAMDEQEKREHYHRLQRKKADLEAMLRAIEHNREQQTEQEEELYENTSKLAQRFRQEHQRRTGEGDQY